MAGPTSGNTSALFEGTPQGVGTQFTSADTTAKKTIFTAAAQGSRLDSISCCTNDTTTVNLAFYKSFGGTDYYIGNVNLPITAGYTTIPKVEALNILEPQLGFMFLGTGWTIKVNCVATMTAAKTTDIVTEGGDF